MKIKLSQLEKLSQAILRKRGFSKREAAAITKVIMSAELDGKTSHGVIKLVLNQAFSPDKRARKPKIRRIKNSIFIEAKYQNAMVVGEMAVNELIKLTKKYPIAMVAINSTTTSMGVMSHYTRRLAQAGSIGIAMASTPAFVAPFGSAQALLGTNPLSMAIPNVKNPIVLDMATSEISMYEVMQAAKSGTKLPPLSAIDKNGKITVDPQDVIDGGALLPFKNSPKSSGLAFMIEVLAGLFISANKIGSKQPSFGSFFIAINASSFISSSQFKNQLKVLIDQYARAKTINSKTKLRYPGQRAAENRIKIQRTQYVEVPQEVFKLLLKEQS